VIHDIEEFRSRKRRSALMFAETALSDAQHSYTVEPDAPLASAIGHLRCAVSDLQEDEDNAR
jgi:hypothetical protein